MLCRILILFIASLTACEKPSSAQHQSSPVTTVERKSTAGEKPGVEEATQIASLIDPTKLGTLRERGANPRILKITAILWQAKAAGKYPNEITRRAISLIGWEDTLKGDLTSAAILRNLDIVEQLGSTTPEDIAEMRQGQSPAVRRGPCAGDIVSVDHIIPVAAAPELSNTIANLELMPLRLNKSKNDSIGARQRSLARQLQAAGLLERQKLPE
ncbi:MAG: hypothetical protein EAZ82_07750 [Verrucomicrobia bacterium]|nr:MAG: hypothetical protein EAZ82_07750 [Verrucomicrobiota bacterium]